MRNKLAAILLWISWPVCVIHRIWNNYPITPVRWIIKDKTVQQDFRWYLVYNELWLSATLVIIAMLISKNRTRTIILLLWSLMCISIVDIVNYWLWFRRNEWALTLEGVIMVGFTAVVFIKSKK